MMMWNNPTSSGRLVSVIPRYDAESSNYSWIFICFCSGFRIVARNDRYQPTIWNTKIYKLFHFEGKWFLYRTDATLGVKDISLRVKSCSHSPPQTAFHGFKGKHFRRQRQTTPHEITTRNKTGRASYNLKRLSFGLQKTAFWNVKHGLLGGKRPCFTLRVENWKFTINLSLHKHTPCVGT